MSCSCAGKDVFLCHFLPFEGSSVLCFSFLLSKGRAGPFPELQQELRVCAVAGPGLQEGGAGRAGGVCSGCARSLPRASRSALGKTLLSFPALEPALKAFQTQIPWIVQKGTTKPTNRSVSWSSAVLSPADGSCWHQESAFCCSEPGLEASRNRLLFSLVLSKLWMHPHVWTMLAMSQQIELCGECVKITLVIIMSLCGFKQCKFKYGCSKNFQQFKNFLLSKRFKNRTGRIIFLNKTPVYHSHYLLI